MTRRRIITIILALVLLVAGLTIFLNRHTIFPSQQMKDLRQLEARLDLPKSQYRYEDDQGLYKDLKGAQHYGRHIALSYEDTSVFDTLKAKLTSDSWQEQAISFVGADNHFSFTKGTSTAKQCVNGYTHPKDSDGMTLYASLEAAGEYSCNFTQ